MASALEIIGGISTGAFGLWALIATVRNGGLRVTKANLTNENKRLDGALQAQTTEYLDYKRRAKERIEALLDEVESLEDARHAEIAKIEDPVRRRTRRRAFVAELLSETTNSGGDSDDTVFGDPTAEGGTTEDSDGTSE